MKISLFTRPSRSEDRGFALVVAVSMLVLLLLLAVGMLSLSAMSTRETSVNLAMEQARANARMALMMAIGDLQVEMGPDMRISAEAAIHDRDPSTPYIEGIAQPHWTAVYDSWGNYLNAPYTPEGKESRRVDSIQDTYRPRRPQMFRRWLVSMPESLQTNVNSVIRMPAEEDTVIMVGAGTLGADHVADNPNDITRAFKIQTEDRGAYAWWVSPENHKAKVNLAARQRELDSQEWVVAQGNAAEVAVGSLDSLGNLDADADLAQRILSFKTLTLPSVSTNQDMTNSMFFDLSEVSSGLLTNTRSGGLKKDLSLLFENDHSTIPAQYKQAATYASGHSSAQEPSIRPLSYDILAEGAVVPRRPFTTWPRMRHYYRMYRQDTDPPPTRNWKGQRRRYLQRDARGIPHTETHAPENMRGGGGGEWQGQNSYLRFPVLLRYLLIHGYYTEEGPNEGETTIRYVDIPVVTLWNPYSTPLRIRDGDYGMAATSLEAWPNRLVVRWGTNEAEVNPATWGAPVGILSPDGSDTIFKPGEIKVFSFSGRGTTSGSFATFGFREGFDATLMGGVEGARYIINTADIGSTTLDVKFHEFMSDRWQASRSDLRNAREGNTPGSPSFRMGLRAGTGADPRDDGTPAHYQIDWFQPSQRYQSMLGGPGNRVRLIETPDPLPIAYSVMTLKTTQSLPPAVGWARDWRSRNWLHQPPYGYGGGLYMTNGNETTAHTQRLESSYTVSFGPATSFELLKLTGVNINGDPVLGFGSNPFEKVSAIPALELPSAPLSSLASFSGMRTNPGWANPLDLNPDWTWRNRTRDDADRPLSFYAGYNKMYQYQSGITGGGIGNSFAHPMIPRDKIYHFHNNSISTHTHRNGTVEVADTKAYSDYWDHTFVLNDALWDEYFISSIADQTRLWASAADNLNDNIQSLTAGEGLPISRYQYHDAGLDAVAVRDKLTAEDGYLRAAEHLKVDGAFNVNSTSVNAWYALFKGIRERKLYYRDTTSGNLREVDVPNGHIALSRFDIPTTDKETTDLSNGVQRDDGEMVWSGVRFISDEQLRLLAEKCVEQVKLRGPFLNMSEFINRRLEPASRRGGSGLALMGALQSAIDFDDAAPDSRSINYRFKSAGNLRIDPGNLGNHEYPTADAVQGSRLAGIPGYVIQSDLLKPIANTLQVRDDTFRIRAYGETLNSRGEVIARAWCEAIVQRNPEYVDPTNDPYEPAFIFEGNPPDDTHDPGWNGEFTPNSSLTPTNRRFGRKFEMKSFRWLSADEV